MSINYIPATTPVVIKRTHVVPYAASLTKGWRKNKMTLSVMESRLSELHEFTFFKIKGTIALTPGQRTSLS